MRWNARLPFALLLGVRSHLGANRMLSAFAVLAAAAAVALAAGLEMSARSVDAEIARTGDELAGAAQLEITAGNVGIPDSLLDIVAATPGVQVAAPLVEETFRVAEGPHAGSALHLMGVDLLSDPKVRTYSYTNQVARLSDPLRLLAQPGAVIVSDALAHELGLEQGSTLMVRRERTTSELTVRGILAPGGVADAFGGRIAVSDVYLLQTMLGRQGWLDRIEVVVEPSVGVDAVMQTLSEALTGRATVRHSATRSVWVDNTLGSVRLVVSVTVIVAILVASLLSYAAMSLFVDRRTRELALLRAAGLERDRLRRFLYADGLLLALVGSALGLLGALVLARSLVALLSAVTDFLQDVEIARLELVPRTVAVAFGVGIAVSLGGMVLPALRASQRPPVEELTAARPRAPAAAPRSAVLASLTVWIALLLVCSVSLGLRPLLRIGAILVLGLTFVVLAGRVLLPGMLAWLRPFLEGVLPGIGRLAGASLVVHPFQTGVHVAAVAGVVAGVCVSGVLGQSLAQTLDVWTASQFPGGIFVSPDAGLSFRNDAHLAPTVVATIRSSPGVRALFEQYAVSILYRGEEVLLSASDMRVMAEHGQLPALGIDGRALATAVAAGEVAISDGFAKRFGVRFGDAITLDTPPGPRTFRVAGLLRDYAGPSGTINVDLHVFDSLWQRPGARNVVIWTDLPPRDVVRQIEERTGEQQELFFTYGPELQRYATRLLSRFTRILDLLAMLTAALGGVAILNLLLGSVAERRRELALLRSTGATRGQVAALVMIDGVIAGCIGGAAGVALGILCAYPLTTGVVADALGWSLGFSIAYGKLALLLGAVVLASCVAATYPAWLARGVLTREALAPE